MHRLSTCVTLACAGLFLPSLALAATYTVGPSGRDYTQLTTLVDNVNLEPGDVVLVDGGATYTGGVVIRSNDGGSAQNPVTFRWSGTGSSRPRIQGGTHTVKFQQSNHVVFQGFDVRGGSSTCLFNEANDVVVRDSIIRDCPGHGILAADQLSGSFTLEHSEIFNAGAGSTKHAIYMQSDEVAFPNAVFTMRFNYVHDGNGGNLLKTRHQRSLVHYNWFEGAAYQEIELIGPDCFTQQDGWSPELKREDAELVGNVIVHTSDWGNAIRAGGDLNGRSNGRVRMVNNTILFNRSGSATAFLAQLGVGSVEMHNNVVYQTTGGAPSILRENPASGMEDPYCAPYSREPWAAGRKVAGSNNWVQSGATNVPGEWTGTVYGSNPQFANVGQLQLKPAEGSALVLAGNPSPQTASAFPFPSPLARPLFNAPARAKLAIGAQTARPAAGQIDIGALASGQAPVSQVPRSLRGSKPLIPGNSPTPGFMRTKDVAAPAAGPSAAGPVVTQPQADAAVAPAAKSLRITPPILLLWQRIQGLWDEQLR